MGYDNDKILARLWYDAARVSRSLAAQIGSLFAGLAMKIITNPEESIEAFEATINRPSAAFTSQDVARSVYREAASQCEIVTSSLEDIYPCTLLQEQQIQTSIQQKSGSRLDQLVFEVPTHVSKTRLHNAWDTVAAASPALRTRIVSLRQGGICQVTVKANPGWNDETSLSDYLQWDRDFRIRYGGPLCRFGEVDQPDSKRYFVLSIHPAVYDPYTLHLISNAVRTAYNNEGESSGPFQPFSTFIRRLSGRQNRQVGRDFWSPPPGWSHEALPQFPRVPYGASEPDLSSSGSLEIQIPITGLGDDDAATLSTRLQAAWAFCLSRVSGDNKAYFGIHVDGRSIPLAGIDRINGPVASVLPCAIDLAALDSGDSLLGVMREHVNTVTAFLHTRASSEKFASHATETTLQAFRNVLIIQNDCGLVQETDPPDFVELIETRSSESSFDGARLVTRCRVMPHGTLRIDMQFDKQVISPQDIEILLQQYTHAIQQLLSKSSTPLVGLKALSKYERSLLLEWNKNSPSGVDACVQDQIQNVTKAQPHAPAVCSWDGDLDYTQLDDLSDRMAALLQKNGVRRGVNVPFFWEKSTAATVVMIGILKAGGALVAMDSDHPVQRLSTILADVGASTIVVSTALSERVKTKATVKNTVIVDMERLRDLPPGGPEQATCQPSDTCYIIYTSGSTGTPKGIIVSHSNLATSVHYNRGLLGMTAASRVLQFSNIIFDGVMYEVFMTLASGGCVCVPQEAERLNNIPGVIQRMRVNWVLLSPSTATLLKPSEVPTLRTLCLGGEAFPRNMVERWKHVRLINAYGPSEVSVSSSQCVVSPNSGKHHLNIGRPTACRYWVVDPDDHNQLLPVGCPGELLVQGPIVAQGYLGDVEKTRNTFIESPTWTEDFDSLDLSSQRWYKTGDLVIQTADGSVVIHGRKGTQVKLAGQRIELEEIEHHLGRLSNPGWKLAVELVRPSGQEQDPCLAMFFAVPSVSGESTGLEIPCETLPPLSQKASMLRQALVPTLPSYMVPQYFVRVNRLPLTSSGKIDRQRLRKLGASLAPEQLSAYSGLAAGSKQEKPHHDHKKVDHVKVPETELRKLWARELAIPLARVKATDNFFSLGGSSIRAMRLVNTARRSGFALSVADVFTAPVLSDMAATLRPVSSGDTGKPNGVPARTPLAPSSSSSFSSTSISSSLMTYLKQLGFLASNIESVAEATDAQADMAALTEVDGEGFYVTITMESTAGLEVAHITRACERTIEHHPLLRTVFVQHGAVLQQVVLKSPPKGMVLVIQERYEDEGDHVGMNSVFGDKLPQFLLETRGARCHKLRLKIRHALYDAISLPIILQDLGAAYAQRALSKGPRFHDWISHVRSLDTAASRNYWKQALHGSSMTSLVPPTGSATSGVPCSDEITMRVPLPTTSYGTPSSVVQAAWALILSRATGKQDIVFGAPNANRISAFPNVDRVPGPCLNNLPVRACLDHPAVTTFASLVAQIQERAVAAIPHQHVGFRDIIRNCTDWPLITRFSSVVLYQNHESILEHGTSLKFGDVDCACSGSGGVGQAADAWLVVVPEASELVITMFYSRRRLPEEKAHWMARVLQTILESMPTALEQPVQRIAQDGEKMPTSAVPAVASVPYQPNGQGASSQSIQDSHLPNTLMRTIVSQAWAEVGLMGDSGQSQKEKEEYRSMFSCGADLVTTMLLSRSYQRRGYGLSMQDILDHPTQEDQSAILESKVKKELNGKKDG